jgi:large subunit ribosomal protein L29
MPLKSDEIREMSDGDIRARVVELEEERFRLKFRSATEPLENPLRLRTIRRDIARLKTILRERQLAAAGGRTATGPEGTGAGTRGRQR